MLLTPEAQRRNQRQALAATLLVAGTAGWLTWLIPLLWPLLGLCPFTYWWVRRPCLRRIEMMRQPFPEEREEILRAYVAFFLALDEAGKIIEFKVMVRPLKAINLLHAKMRAMLEQMSAQ